MTTLYDTSFSGGDANPLPAPWTAVVGAMRQLSNKGCLAPGAGFSIVYDSGRAYPADHIAEIVVDTVGTARDFGVAIRAASGQAYFVIGVNGIDLWLYKYTGGFESKGTWAGVNYSVGQRIGVKVTTGGGGEAIFTLLVEQVETGTPLEDDGVSTPVLTAGAPGFSGNDEEFRISRFIGSDTGASTSPVITNTSSSTPTPGSSLTLTGTNFGATQGTGYVTLGGVLQTVTSWSDTSIVIDVVRGSNKYGSVSFVVTNDAAAGSTGFSVTLTPPSGWAAVTLASLNPNPALRLRAFADLASGDQIAWDTKGGLVVVYSDGTASFHPSVYKFAAELWSTGQGWSALAEQVLYLAHTLPGQVVFQLRRAWRKAQRTIHQVLDLRAWAGLAVEKWYAPELTFTVSAVSGTSSGTVSIGGTAAGTVTDAGTSSGTVAPGGNAAGTVSDNGNSSGTITPAGTGAGSVTSIGTSAGTVSLAGTAAGSVTVAGLSAGSVVLGGTAAGTVTSQGASAFTMPLTGSRSGEVAVSGSSSGVVTIGGTGSDSSSVSGGSSGLVTVGGTGSGTVSNSGSSSATLTPGGTAAGEVVSQGSSTGAVGLAGTAAGSVSAAGSSSGVVPIGGTGSGEVGSAGTVTGSSAGLITVGGSASGSVGAQGSSAGSISLAGVRMGTVDVAGQSVGSISIGGYGFALTGDQQLGSLLSSLVVTETQQRVTVTDGPLQ